MQKAISRNQKDQRYDQSSVKNARRRMPLQTVTVPFTEASRTAKKAFSELSTKLNDVNSFKKKRISMKEIVLQMREFFENVELNQNSEKNLVAAFAPVHSFFMSLVFCHYPSTPNPFLMTWELFSQSFNIFADAPKCSFTEEFGKLRELLDTDAFGDSIEAFEETLNSFK